MAIVRSDLIEVMACPGGCIFDDCVAKRSKELYSEMASRLRDLKMDSFVKVKTLRMKENHPDNGIFVMLDNKHIDPEKLTNLYKSIKS